MPKNDGTHGRKKVAWSLCTVSILTVAVLSVVGVYKFTSRAGMTLNLGVHERSHRGRMLLALLKNSTHPANSTGNRAGFLWDRFLDKVREALYTTKTRRLSGSSTASRLSHSEERPATSVTSTMSSTSPRWAETISFDEDTTIVDYGKIDDHVILDAGSTSANDSRAHSERHGLNWKRGGSADSNVSSFNYDAIEPNVKLGKAVKGSNGSVNGFNDTASLGSPAGTEHVRARFGAGSRKEISRTNCTLTVWKEHEDGPIPSSTPPDARRVSENEAHERASRTQMNPSSLEAPAAENKPIGVVSAIKSNDGTMRGTRMQETQPELEWASSSIQRKDSTPQKASIVERKYTATGSTFLRSGVNEVVGRVTWTSRTSENINHSVDPFELESSPLEELRRDVDAKYSAGSPTLPSPEKENASQATALTSNVTLELSGLKGTGIFEDSEENFRWSKNDGDILVGTKSDVSGAAFGIARVVPGSNRAPIEGVSSVTFDFDEGIPYLLTKPPGYRRRMKVSEAGSALHSIANAAGNPEGSLVPNNVRETVSDGSIPAGDGVYPIKADNPSPRSHPEHLLNNGSVKHLYLSNVTESDKSTSSLDPEARFPGTLRVARTTSKANLTADAWFAKPLDLNNSQQTEGWGSAGESQTRPSIAEDHAYDRAFLRRQRPRGGESSAEGVRQLSERPLLNAKTSTSASPSSWRPVEETGKFRQLRVGENGGRNTEPFQEDIPPQEEARPATEKKATSADPAPPSLEGHPRDYRPTARGSLSTTTADSFNLLRELDRIADEFTEFLERKERRERDEDRIYTTVDPEEELLDADAAITTVVDGDHSLAASSEVDDLGVEWGAMDIGGPTIPGGVGPTVFPTRDEEEFSEHPAEERKNRIASEKTGSPLYCSVGPTYSGPLPPALCSYFVVYDSVHYDSNKKTLQAVFRGSWSELADSVDRFRLGPRVLLALDANQLRAVLTDFPVSAVFAAKARSLILEGSLSGLAFDLSLATDYDARSHATLLQGTRDYMPGYHFVGLIDFIAATGLLRTNLAELAGSVHKLFLRNDPRHVHTIGTSVPNPFASPNRKSYSVENAMRLAESLRLVSPDRDHVCLSVSLAVYKFNVLDQDVDPSTNPGVGSLASYVNTAFSYSELCEEYRDPHRHFDDATLSTYVHVGEAWLGFDDDMSMEIKIDKLSRGHRVGCLLADNIDLDDFRNVCKKGDFPRLRLLKRSVLSRERR